MGSTTSTKEEQNKTDQKLEVKKDEKIEESTPKILALGDSLTHGYYFRGYKQHSYCIKLNELIKKNSLDYEAIEYGESGEVTEGMYKRCQKILKLNQKNQFQVAIILGGTNDLAYKLSAEQIFENLKKIHELCFSQGVMMTICVTIPENVVDFDYEEYNERKRKTNDLLREYVKQNQQKMVLCDLYSKIPYSSTTEEERKELWDDNLHFTPKGYDKMGEEIFNVFFDRYVIDVEF
eukprot:gene284-6699_t